MAPTDCNPTAGGRRWLIFVCVLAATTHGFVYLAYPDVPLSPDEREYAALGERLAAGGDLRLPTGEVAKRMPLYPVFIAAIRGLGGPDHWRNAVLAYQILLALCGTILLALIAERVGGRRAGWIAGTVAALYSPYRFLQAMLLTETLVIFLLYIAVLLYIAICLQARSPAGRGIAIIGVSVLIGLATLARANALLFLVPFAADTGFRAGSTTRRAVRVAAILVPALVCATLWGVRFYRQRVPRPTVFLRSLKERRKQARLRSACPEPRRKACPERSRRACPEPPQ